MLSAHTRSLVQRVLAQPLSTQLGILRVVAPPILRQLDRPRRAGFLRDLNAELDSAEEEADVPSRAEPPA